jgi:hypothetical protein
MGEIMSVYGHLTTGQYYVNTDACEVYMGDENGRPILTNINITWNVNGVYAAWRETGRYVPMSDYAFAATPVEAVQKLLQMELTQ